MLFDFDSLDAEEEHVKSSIPAWPARHTQNSSPPRPAYLHAAAAPEEGAARVLVIGAGPTGCLAAAHLRRLATAAGLQLHLSIFEQSRGPGGRMADFWPSDGPATYGQVVADLGAQVVSFDPSDAAVKEEVSQLVNRGLLELVPPGRLASTVERPNSHLSHYWALGGTSSLLMDYLKDSAPQDLRFNWEVKRLQSEQSAGGASWHVAGRKYDNPWPRTAMGGGGWSYGVQMAQNAAINNAEATTSFDAVIVAVNAREAASIGGMESILPSSMKKALVSGSFSYDARLVYCLYLDPQLRSRLTKCFGEASELSFEEDAHSPRDAAESPPYLYTEHPAHLVAWQDIKRDPYPANTHPTVITVHCKRSFSKALLLFTTKSGYVSRDPCPIGLGPVKVWLARWLGISEATLEESVLDVKTLCWSECQATPTKQNSTASHRDCMVIQSTPPLIFCGDYLVESTFAGCQRSARAGASKLLELLPRTRLKVA